MATQLRARRNDKMIQPKRHDTYKNRGKFSEPTVCGGCGAVFLDGRWSWAAAPKGSKKDVCADDPDLFM